MPGSVTGRRWERKQTTAAEVLEQSDYLPYGTRIQNPDHLSGLDNRWRYAAKEAQRFGSTDAFSPSNPTAFGGAGSLDLSLLDFGARMYDPFVARWTAVDKKAKKYLNISSSVYCCNNPLRMIDKKGLEAGDYYSYFGHYVGSDGLDDNRIFLVDDLTITNYLNLDLNSASQDQILSTLSVNADEVDGLIIIDREEENEEHTQGSFSTIGEDSFEGYTMERPGPPTTTPNLRRPIPKGFYDTVPLEYDFAGGFAFSISNNEVSQARHIYGHVGNTPDDSSGCILFGLGISSDNSRITQSRKAMGKFRTFYTDKDNVKMIIR